jgi:hypothetical protein
MAEPEHCVPPLAGAGLVHVRERDPYVSQLGGDCELEHAPQSDQPPLTRQYIQFSVCSKKPTKKKLPGIGTHGISVKVQAGVQYVLHVLMVVDANW